jgi:hypothetical protein
MGSQAWEAEAQYEAQYKQAVDWANGISQQALVREFPELRSLPAAQGETTLGVIGRQDASRLQRDLGLIQNVVTASAEQTRPQNEQQAKRQAQQQEQVEKWARAKGQRYEAWAQKESLTARLAARFRGVCGVPRSHAALCTATRYAADRQA